MTIFSQIYGSLKGGWKTHGPNALIGPGAFDTPSDGVYESVTDQAALRLSAVWACMNIRAETIGTFPLQLRNGKKEVLTDHPLYNILHTSPNADMTASEFWSLATAYVDMHGNFVSIIERGTGKKVVALTPVDLNACTIEFNKSGWRKRWKIGQDWHSDDDILHLRGFSMNAFARMQSGLKQMVQVEVGPLSLGGELVGVLDLTQDLHFAQYEAVE